MKHQDALKLGVIMDPIASIKPHHDSTFAMLLAAQARDWPIFYMEPHDLFIENNQAMAAMQALQVRDHQSDWFNFTAPKVQNLAELDVILMRKDPPVDQQYIYTTQILDLAARDGVLIVNKPQSLRDFNEKLFIHWFSQCAAPTLVTQQAAQVRRFIQQYKDVIAKPLYGMGGLGIFRLQKDDPNINVVIETLTQKGATYMLAQQYLPQIAEGDKRILLIDGKPIPHAYARFAPANDNRANIAAGGRGKAVPLSKRDYWLCEQIAPVLQERGILFAGIDVIGDYLTEINITSPTCIRELDKECGLNIADELLTVILNKVKRL